ncbi:hypothetical protein D3C86_1107830 [compost metagenome]
MALHIRRLVLSLVHQAILDVDVVQRQLDDGKQLGRRRVGIGEGLVGDYVHGVDGKTVILAARQPGLVPIRGIGGHLQPHHILARHQLAAEPVRGPGVVEHRLAGLITGQGIGDQGRVVALLVGDGRGQAELVQMMVDGPFAAPARVAAHQIGLAVPIAVKQRRQLGILELPQVGDAVPGRCLLVDEVALGGAGHIGALTEEHLVTPCLLVLVVLQRYPVEGEEGAVPLRHRGVGHVVVHLLGGLHLVAETTHQLADQQALEGLLRQGALQGLHLDPLPRQLGAGHGEGTQQQGAQGQSFGDLFHAFTPL